MVNIVNRRFFRTLIYVLVAGQLLLSAPIVSAMSAWGSTSTAEAPCADMMLHASNTDPCPCCLEGDMGNATCLSACTASVGAISTYQFSMARMAVDPLPVTRVAHIARASDPPLKPPPIV